MAPEFAPAPLLGNPHLQTILGSVLPAPKAPPSEQVLVPVGHGDKILVRVSRPKQWRPDGRAALLVHGLCGCERSPYMRRLARRLFDGGALAARMNCRGAGPGIRCARGFAHGGQSDDLWSVLSELRDTYGTRFDLVGFSLGGNVALKLAGELGAEAPALIGRCVAVCAPVDLARSAELLEQESNRWYRRHFVQLLKQSMAMRQRLYPEVAYPVVPASDSILEFDDTVTAPVAGFAGAADYYQKASANRVLSKIVVKTRLIFAADDPFLEPVAAAAIPPAIKRQVSSHGGHLGFLARPTKDRRGRWLDQQVLEFLARR